MLPGLVTADKSICRKEPRDIFRCGAPVSLLSAVFSPRGDVFRAISGLISARRVSHWVFFARDVVNLVRFLFLRGCRYFGATPVFARVVVNSVRFLCFMRDFGASSLRSREIFRTGDGGFRPFLLSSFGNSPTDGWVWAVRPIKIDSPS